VFETEPRSRAEVAGSHLCGEGGHLALAGNVALPCVGVTKDQPPPRPPEFRLSSEIADARDAGLGIGHNVVLQRRRRVDLKDETFPLWNAIKCSLIRSEIFADAASSAWANRSVIANVLSSEKLP
jgi:hypothetical protein